MRTLILFAGFLLVAVSCSKNSPVNFEQLQDRGGLFYMPGEKEPYTGGVIAYQAGKTVLEGEMKNGLRHGLWIMYFASGQKQAEGHYVDGQKDGTWNYWRVNGDMDVTERYVSGIRQGHEIPMDSDTVSLPPAQAPQASSSKAEEPAPDKKVAEEKKEEPVQAREKEPEKPKPVVWDRLRGGGVKTLDGVPYTGDVVKYFRSGGIELKGHFTHGRRSGKWTFYWPNGTVKDVKYY